MSIYVLRSDNLMKIGFSDNLRNRVQSIISTVPVPVEFVGHMPGDREVEKHLHKIFAEQSFSGEWFVETEQMRDFFATILIPRLPPPEPAAQVKRTVERASTADLSEKVRQEAGYKWPTKSKAEIVIELAKDLGWSKTRAKDFYYADPRLALRAFELAEVDKWLQSSRRWAYRIAPELKESYDEQA